MGKRVAIVGFGQTYSSWRLYCLIGVIIQRLRGGVKKIKAELEPQITQITQMKI